MTAERSKFEKRAGELLAEWFRDLDLRLEQRHETRQFDLLAQVGKQRFLIEVKSAGDAATVSRAADQILEYARALRPRALPVIAVPFMGDVGKRICAERGVAWFDLSGNADLSAPGIRLLIDGKPNRFVRRGRPSTAFAPKSARIARRLLIEPQRVFRQQELARLTGLDDGFTSRIVNRLERDGLILRDNDRAIRVAHPERLLDAWREHYRFDRHTLVAGHVVAKSGEELTSRVAAMLRARRIPHAATGLAAAWLMTKFAAFRLATFYVHSIPNQSVLKDLHFRPQESGANVWLVVPSDEGVFDGARERSGVDCVHPVQAYLDLAAHPERAAEAADEVRAQLLTWTTR